MLYIVSTPIGNLEDITLRAVKVLKEADYIAAEDTRHSAKLLKTYDIKTPLISFHSYSDKGKLQQLIGLLKCGKNVALISDSGTPGISDPGYSLIRATIEENIQVSPIPGASAALAALTASGLPMRQFLFVGFLPLKKGRQTLLKKLKIFLEKEELSIVIFESPHRLLKTLENIGEFMGDVRVSVAREMTKMHEEFFRGRVSEAREYFGKKGARGEFVLVLSGD